MLSSSVFAAGKSTFSAGEGFEKTEHVFGKITFCNVGNQGTF